MKTFKKILIAALLVLSVGALTACSNNRKSQNTSSSSSSKVEKNNHKNKTMIIYFSLTGHTKKAAEYIQKQTGADLVRIEAKKPYSTDYKSVKKRAKQEQNANIRPEIKDKIQGFSEYGNILIGYPTWYGKQPMIINTLFNNYDFKGKNVSVFTTSGGDSIASSEQAIRRLAQDGGADFTDGIRYTGHNQAQVDKWLQKIGLVSKK